MIVAPSRPTSVLAYSEMHHQEIGVPSKIDEAWALPRLVTAEHDLLAVARNAKRHRRGAAVRDGEGMHSEVLGIQDRHRLVSPNVDLCNVELCTDASAPNRTRKDAERPALITEQRVKEL